jgi:hypothetical protein
MEQTHHHKRPSYKFPRDTPKDSESFSKISARLKLADAVLGLGQAVNGINHHEI